MREDAKYWIWLCSLEKLGNVRSRRLLEFFGHPRDIWEAKPSDLTAVRGIDEAMISLLTNEESKQMAATKVDDLYAYGIKICTLLDDAYPYYLKNIYDPPVALFIRGNLIEDEKYIAIVGSRRASSYGLGMAETLGFELARAGFTVVSGLARGIDSFAHKGALRAGGRTLAVQGCGVDQVYPPENVSVFHEIVQNGAIVSEYVTGSEPLKYHFPARNRIISGLSMGTIVVEAWEKSGSLITAQFALDQGREVFAVPGNIDSFNSRGTNKLIKEGAKLITEVNDILEEFFGMDKERLKKKTAEYNQIQRNTLINECSPEEKQIIECLALEPQHIDNIAIKTGFTMQTINSLLILMELEGIIEQLPGKIFKRK